MFFLLLVVLLASCGSGGDGGGGGFTDEGSLTNPVNLGVIDTTRSRSSQVGSGGTSFYWFTASTTGVYTISLTNTRSDLSWVLSFDPTYFSILTFCDKYVTAVDEVCATQISLSTNDVLYLAVDEWDGIAGSFTLTITPNTTGGGGEGSIAIPISLGSTPVTRNGASVGAWGSSYYQFNVGTTASRTISLTNTQSDLSWTLFTDSNFSNLLWWCDNYLYNNDEICTTPTLNSGATYYLIVDEWDNVTGTFDLTVTP